MGRMRPKTIRTLGRSITVDCIVVSRASNTLWRVPTILGYVSKLLTVEAAYYLSSSSSFKGTLLVVD